MARKPVRRGRHIDDVTLMPVSPSRQRQQKRLWLLAGVCLSAGLFLLGLWLGESGALDTTESNRRLRSQVSELSDALAAARSELAVYRTDTQVTSKAREQVRQQIKRLRDQVAELEEAVAFYKNVMAPGADQGLQIEKLTVEPDSDSDDYRYQLVLVQVGDNSRYLSGDVAVRLLGSRDGEPVTIGSKQLLDENSETDFRFRFFQELNGRFTVPAGVQVDVIEVDAESRGGRRFETQKTLQWQ